MSIYERLVADFPDKKILDFTQENNTKCAMMLKICELLKERQVDIVYVEKTNNGNFQTLLMILKKCE